MTRHEIYRELNCSVRLYEYDECFVRVEHPSVRFVKRQLNETDVETTIHTPAGRQVMIQRTTSTNWFLLDGIPAVYFDHTFPVDLLVEAAHRLIELFAPKLVLGISDEIASTGDLERVRIVGDIVDGYNARFD